MNKKIMAALTAALLVFMVGAACCFLAGAASAKTVYVKDGGSGNGSSAASAAGSLTAAVQALGGEGGNIVVCGTLTVNAKTTIPEQSGDLTITAENGGCINLSNRLQFAKNENDNVITLDCPLKITASYDCFILGGFNSIVFGPNFDVTSSGGGMLSFMGGVHASETPDNADCITELPYSVTVHNGVFNRFTAGNVRSTISDVVGSIAAPVSVTVHGGVFGKSGSYDLETNNKTFEPFSVSGMTQLASDVSLTITGGTFYTPVYIHGRKAAVPAGASENSALTASDEKYYALDGDIEISITGGSFYGGEISAYYTCASYTQVLRGNFDVTIGAGASFSAGTVIDATQVKARAGSDACATLTYPETLPLTAKRFDVVNGQPQRYEEPLRVAFIGDSITEGYPVDRMTQSYPAQFLKICETAGKEVLVANYGVSASGILPTTRRYYPEMLAYPLALNETDADIVVFALGTNDANIAGGTTGALEKFYTDYKAFIEAMGSLPDTERVYVTSALYRKTSSAAADVRAVSVIRPLQKRIAAELDAEDPGKYTFVDLYALTMDAAIAGTLLSADNLHPGEAGYAYMGQAVYDALFNNIVNAENFEMTDIYVSDSGRFGGAGTADDPMSSITVALGRAASEAVIHIVGTVSYSANLNIPSGVNKITFTGKGADAVLSVNGNIKLGCDVKFDNLTLASTYSPSSNIYGCFNDIEITDTVQTAGTWNLFAGHNVFSDLSLIDPSSLGQYDTVESASGGEDCVITVSGGVFQYVAGGNQRCVAQAPLGVYSGNMTLNIGGSARVTGSSYTGVCGMNYLTGTISANISSWGDVVLRDYAQIGTLTNVEFKCTRNTGKITVNVADGVEVERIVAGDFNGDGALTLADALMLLRYVVNGFDPDQAAVLFDNTDVSLVHVLYVLRQIAP